MASHRVWLGVMCLCFAPVGYAFGATNAERGAALVDAVSRNDVPRVKALLEQGADPNTEDAEKSALIWHAPDQEMLRLLLNHGADINSRRNGTGVTLLFYTAAKGKPEHIKFLLDHGADVNVRSKGGDTPLMWAARIGMVENVRMLVERGADVNAHDERGKSALSGARERLAWAKSKAQTEKPPVTKIPMRQQVIALLVKHGAKE